MRTDKEVIQVFRRPDRIWRMERANGNVLDVPGTNAEYTFFNVCALLAQEGWVFQSVNPTTAPSAPSYLFYR